MIWLIMLFLFVGCGQDGHDDRETEPETIIGTDGEDGEDGLDGQDGENGTDGTNGTDGVSGEKGEKGDTGSQGPQGTSGPQGPQGDVGPSCSVIERLVYKDNGDLEQRKCDVYIICPDGTEVFIVRKKHACE